MILSSDWAGDDCQWCEDWQRDGIDVGARSVNDEVLVQSAESKLARGTGKEWLGGRDLSNEVAEETILLTLLSDD